MSYVVLIQIHGEAEKLAKCLDSLANQTLLPDSVIIVDDGTPNDSVLLKFEEIINSRGITRMKLEYIQAAHPKKPNLDTVGKALLYAWLVKVSVQFNKPLYDYVSIIDVDSLPTWVYYERILKKMEADSDLMCASGVIIVNDKREKTRIKDARGSGKVIRTDFLANIPLNLFPEITWDTWINTKAKLAGKKTRQIPGIYLYSTRRTTKLTPQGAFWAGRLAYHFGYNPLLLFGKILKRRKGVWRGYQQAKHNQWRLPDPEVRKWFGWRYFFHFWK